MKEESMKHEQSQLKDKKVFNRKKTFPTAKHGRGNKESVMI